MATDSHSRTRLQLFAGLALAALGPALLGARWAWQQSRVADADAIYTNLEQRFYLADPTLGSVAADERWFWLGLDALGISFAVAIVATLILTLGRRWSKHAPPFGLALSGLLTMSGIVSLAIALPPEGSHITARPLVISAVEDGSSGFEGSIAGTYVVVDDAANTLTATIAAGGERFDGVFDAPRGSIELDPAEILGPIPGALTVEASSIDAGIPLRTEHAAEMLQAESHPQIVVSDLHIDRSGADANGLVDAAGTAVVVLAGESTRVSVMARISPRGESGYLVQVTFEIDIAESGIAESAEAFDETTITINSRFALELEAKSENS